MKKQNSGILPGTLKSKSAFRGSGLQVKILRFIIVFGLLTACVRAKPPFELSEHWIKLTDTNNEYVVFEPCDASNNEIRLLKNKSELLILWGQEEELLTIQEINQVNSGYQIIALSGTAGKIIFTVESFDLQKNIVQWKWKNSINHEFLMTDSLGLNNFKFIKQPCKECWPEEDCALREVTTELSGIWQNVSEMGSGWSDSYQFFNDGSFIFNYSQMVCDKRTISLAGTWTMNSASELSLTTLSKTIVEGGKLVPATGSCISEFEIEGGETKTMTFDYSQNIQLSWIGVDKEKSNRRVITLDNKKFWKFSDEPTNH